MAKTLCTVLQRQDREKLDDLFGNGRHAAMPHQALITELNDRCVDLERQNAALQAACDRYKASLRAIRNEVGTHGI
jgi:hypothetical protein